MFDQKIMKQYNIDKTPLERNYEKITAVIIVAIVVIIGIFWKNIPATIPIHFDALGRVDDEGSKYTILVFPVLMFCTSSLFNFLRKSPQYGNYPSRLNESNAEQFYLVLRKTLVMINCNLLIMLALVALIIVSTALNWLENSVSIVLVIIMVILMGIPLIYTYIQNRKIK